ncbi:MAG: glycosyltransferase family 2 protein [Acidobacteria bacterium]|nr:glycosyltransferase family 2 protein [Acidobacteriota bacterium]
MSAAPAVTVVLPTWNRADRIGEAIESVLRQSVPVRELIVVDDGSTDGTASVLARYGAPVRVHRQAHAGVSRARNSGLDRAGGEFVAFLDSDDLWKPEKLERQLEVLRDDPGAGAVCCDMVEREGETERRDTFFQRIGFAGEVTPRRMFFLNPIATPTLIARRACLEAAGRFDPDLCGAEDYDFFFRLLRHTRVRPLFRALVIRRIGTRTLSRDRLRMAEGTRRALDRALEAFPGLARELGPAVRRRFARLGVDLAYAHLVGGDGRGARRELFRSLRRSPATGRAWLFLAAALLPRSALGTMRRWCRPGRSAAGGIGS